jgi:putative ABC transport system permease protein
VSGLWNALSAGAQDWLIVAACLAPGAAVGVFALRGFRAGPLIGALLARHAVSNAAFVALIAVSVALGVAVTAQERALRQAAAQAANKFPVVVAAPGDQVRALLGAVYLQPGDMPLVDGATIVRLQEDPQIALMTPIAFGDSVDGAPVVGVTVEFLRHLAGEPTEGRLFASVSEAVVGAASPIRVGDHVEPEHGRGSAPDDGHGVELTVVGRLAATGGPWDRAILTPVEQVWSIHGLADGHAPENAGRLGPPFDAGFIPGAPAVIAAPRSLGGAYAVVGRYDAGDSMAFLPAAVLSRLTGIFGDVRAVMSLMAGITQALVAAGMMLGLTALVRLFARRLALLRALGAPQRFVLAVAWGYGASLVAAGAALGLALGAAATAALSHVLSASAGLRVEAALSAAEAQAAAAFFSVAAILALIPAVAAYRRAPIKDLTAAA